MSDHPAQPSGAGGAVPSDRVHRGVPVESGAAPHGDDVTDLRECSASCVAAATQLALAETSFPVPLEQVGYPGARTLARQALYLEARGRNGELEGKSAKGGICMRPSAGGRWHPGPDRSGVTRGEVGAQSEGRAGPGRARGLREARLSTEDESLDPGKADRRSPSSHGGWAGVRSENWSSRPPPSDSLLSARPRAHSQGKQFSSPTRWRMASPSPTGSG